MKTIDSARIPKSLIEKLKIDFASNHGNTRGRFLVLLYRLASASYFSSFPYRLLFRPFRWFYIVLVQYLMGVDLPPSTRVGDGLRIYHGSGLVVHPKAVLGRNVTLRHGVTIGERVNGGGVPSIGDDVNIGCNAVLLGAISIGQNSKIGACALVLADVPSGGVAMAPVSTVSKLIKT
jgi:putative colanic acid biosynthesis acetyltransferase WcaB